MTDCELMEKLRSEFKKMTETYGLDTDEVTISAKGLSPEEAIGQTKRKDYPILTGREVMLQAEYKEAFGQAFTDAPSDFQGSLREISELDLSENSHNRGLFIAALNAVMAKLGMIGHTVHCKTEEPEKCAREFADFMKQNYSDKKIALVGYQPSLLEALSGEYNVRVLDLNPNNIGQIRCRIKVENGVDDFKAVVTDWADLVLCTGSTLCNGTFVNFIDIGKDVIFFGITAAGAVELLSLKRLCPMSK